MRSAPRVQRRVGYPVGAQRRRVNELHVRQIQQVVDQQLVITLDVEIARVGNPARVVVPVIVGDQVRIGLVRVARPDPDIAVAFHHRIGPHARPRRHAGLTRYRHAGAGCIELQPVIAALDDVADPFAQRQRQMPVAAPVLQRRRRAVLAPEQHHRIAADGAAEQVVGQFMALGGDVPGVFDELFHATKALLPLSPKWPLLRVFLASIGLVGKSRKAVLPSRARIVG